jgi:ChrB-like protein
VLLAYRLPRVPSSPRIALWRKLRQLGAEQLLDGLVALPLDRRTREQLEWLADGIVEAGGEGTIWIGELASAAQERALVAAMTARVAADYARLTAEADSAAGRARGQRRRTLARLRRELRQVRSRDFFPPPERELAARALDALAVLAEEPVT